MSASASGRSTIGRLGAEDRRSKLEDGAALSSIFDLRSSIFDLL